MRNAWQGAATTIMAALKADLSDPSIGGAYFNDCKPTRVASKMPQAFLMHVYCMPDTCRTHV